VLQDLLEHCLKPAPQDRPQTVVEAYLRLQELGKASGVLLLPPGAIESILRSRKTNMPETPPATTVPYRSAAARARRRVLIGMGAVLVLVGMGALLKSFFFTPRPAAEAKESLLGVHIGDSREEAESKLGKMNVRRWSQKPNDVSLGHVLLPLNFLATDLGISETQLGDLDVSWTDDKKVVVLFLDEKVTAMVVHEPHAGATGRGVRIHDDLNTVTEKYDKIDAEPTVKTMSEEQNGVKTMQVEVRRYETLGIGFEIQKGKVVGITLFPGSGKK
jgi:hypothetical protein